MNIIVRRTARQWAVLFIVLTLTIAGLLQVTNIRQASATADDGGYPYYANTICASGSNCSGMYGTYDWGYNLTGGSCPSVDTSCLTYPYGSPPTAGMGDPWDMNVRNCTSFVAWKENQVFGLNISNSWKNANNWNNYATNTLHYTDDALSAPQVGDIADWTSGMYGHVAYVSAVSGSTAYYQQYNYAYDGTFDGSQTSAGSEGQPNYYIHIAPYPFESGFQANTDYLGTYSSAPYVGTNVTTSGIATGTSPSIADTTDGYIAAFHAQNGDLFTYSTATGLATDTGQGMASGTNPAIAAIPGGGWEIVFQNNGGYLYTDNSTNGPSSTTQGMDAGSSPAITCLSSSVCEAAFQTNTNKLYHYNTSTGGVTTSTYDMYAGSSPAIITLSSSAWESSFQANTSNLYVYNSTSGIASNTSQGMDEYTSPSMTDLTSSSYEVAFQANNDNLYVYNNNNGALGLGDGMDEYSSPSISSLSSGSYDITFENNGDYQYVYQYDYGTPSTSNLGDGMAAGTSPSVAWY